MATSTKKRSIGYYTQAFNTGTEYAVREDFVVFVRERYWGGRYFKTSKWTRTDTFNNNIKSLPSQYNFGFSRNGAHILVESTKLRLPQD